MNSVIVMIVTTIPSPFLSLLLVCEMLFYSDMLVHVGLCLLFACIFLVCTCTCLKYLFSVCACIREPVGYCCVYMYD